MLNLFALLVYTMAAALIIAGVVTIVLVVRQHVRRSRGADATSRRTSWEPPAANDQRTP